MRHYLILRGKVAAFRADPDVRAALAARGLAYEHLDQLALEHLYGIR
jgi:hypothetical protein